MAGTKKPKNKPRREEFMEKMLIGPWGITPWCCLGRRIRAEFRKHPVLSMLAVGLAVLVVAKIATARGAGTIGHVGGSGCANQQPGQIDPRDTPCLATSIPPTTIRPATILKLHCGENGIIRPCEDED